MSKCKVAVVQAGSIVMNKERCIDKAIKLIDDAGKQGGGVSLGRWLEAVRTVDVMTFYVTQKMR